MQLKSQQREISTIESLKITDESDKPQPTTSGKTNSKRTIDGQKIKENSCMIYSISTTMAIMLGLIAVFLIVTGHVQSLSLVPPLHKHQHLEPIGSKSQTTNSTVKQAASIFFGPTGHLNDTYFIEEGSDYITLYVDNATLYRNFIVHNETVNDTEIYENLDNIKPEALIAGNGVSHPQSRGYVAYIPVPINGKEDEDDDEDDDDEDDRFTRKKLNSRKRPQAKLPYVVPLMVLPSSAIQSSMGEGRGQANSNTFFPNRNIYSANQRSGLFYTNLPHNSGNLADVHEPESTNSNEQINIPPQFRTNVGNRFPSQFQPSPSYGIRRNEPLHDDDEIDYRMFGKLAPNQNRFLHLRDSRNGHRYDPADEYRQRISTINNYRVPFNNRREPPSRFWTHFSPSINQESNSDNKFPFHSRRGPSRFPNSPVRNPPRPGNHPRSPQDTDYRREYHPRHSYTYPRNAMSIQDIIHYMTSMGNEDNSHEYSRNNNYRGHDRNSYGAHSRQNGYNGNPQEPFAFMMDVYPLRAKNQHQQYHGNRYVPPYHSSGSHQEGSIYRNNKKPDNYDNSDEEDYQRPDYRDNDGQYETNDNRPSEYRDLIPIYIPSHYITKQTQVNSDYKNEETPEQHQKVVLHLNLYKKRPTVTSTYTRTRIEADDRMDHDEYLSASDTYRGIFKNNSGKRDRFSNGKINGATSNSQDDGLPGGESQVIISHKITRDEETEENLYKNHRMDYSHWNDQKNNEHRTSEISRYNNNDDLPELLPIPLAQEKDSNITEHSVKIKMHSDYPKPSIFRKLLG